MSSVCAKDCDPKGSKGKATSASRAPPKRKQRTSPSTSSHNKKYPASSPKKKTTSPSKKKSKKIEMDLTAVDEDQRKDSFVNCQVAFPCKGPNRHGWLDTAQITEEVCTNIGGKFYLCGSVIRAERNSYYTVEQ
mmetsp:Transcript_36681/g.51860  ORF Transcript_36681/g.51860 Transcript_36681/m.51860 type:complete len:134 (-) Transcript_36681:23-424(-)